MTDENNGTEKIPYSTYNTLMLVVGPNKGKSALPLNPVKGDVSDSTLNVGGGQFDTTSEFNDGAP